MREVLAAADDQAIAYPGAPKRETQTLVATFKDWRYFLDLLEQVGGSTPGGRALRDLGRLGRRAPVAGRPRAARRAVTTRLVERADGWQPAYAIRAQMARWALVDAVTASWIWPRPRSIDGRPSSRSEAQLGLDDGGALQVGLRGVPR